MGLADQGTSWPHYVQHLALLASERADDPRTLPGGFSSGWATGTLGWRRAMAREHEHLALSPDLPRAEHEELRAARWHAALEQALRAQGRSMTDAAQSPKSAAWKVAIARQLRNTVAPPYRWLAQSLVMGRLPPCVPMCGQRARVAGLPPNRRMPLHRPRVAKKKERLLKCSDNSRPDPVTGAPSGNMCGG